MKKIILIGLLLMAMIFATGCSDDADTEPKADDNKDKELLTYINENNSLVMESTDGTVKETLIEGKANESMVDYDVCWDEQKIAYIVQADGAENPEDFYTELRIYNLKDATEQVLHRDEWIIRGVEWSPTKDYILMDIGTGVIGSLSLYDIEKADWIKIQDGVYNYSWAPNGEQIALSVREEVTPQTPVEDGSTFTTIVLNLKKDNTIQTVMNGTSNFFVTPKTWGDNNTLFLEKRIFGEENPIYYKVDVSKNSLVEISEQELPTEFDSSSFPDEVQEVLHEISADGKKVLYVKYSEAEDKVKVMLWDDVNQSKKDLGAGQMPKWID